MYTKVSYFENGHLLVILKGTKREPDKICTTVKFCRENNQYHNFCRDLG